eukprot:1138706-Pelagomonas_calceolata.AAC.4
MREVSGDQWGYLQYSVPDLVDGKWDGVSSHGDDYQDCQQNRQTVVLGCKLEAPRMSLNRKQGGKDREGTEQHARGMVPLLLGYPYFVFPHFLKMGWVHAVGIEAG